MPEDVVRIHSPEGVHVIDHLRSTYASLRRYGPTAPVPGDLGGTAGVRSATVDGRNGESALVPAPGVATAPQPAHDERVTSRE